MEINTYTLKRNNDEFKDLTENQLMAIAELCMDYYKKGKFDAIDDAYEDKQDEIDDLQNEVDELELENETLNDKIFDLTEKLKELQKEKDTLQSIVDDTVFKKVKEELNK